jgi:signal transduction histidine kinase
MFLWWGEDLVQVYNDAYRPSLADRHPTALGAHGAEFWTDIWDAIGPQIAQVLSGGESTWHEDQYLPILRNGRMEDVYWTYSYSAVRDDDGSIAGVLVVCQETTPRILSELRARALEEAVGEQRENLMRAIFHQAPVFMAVLRGLEYAFEMVNDAYYQLVGNRAVLGRTLVDALPEIRGQGFIEILDEVMRTGEPFVGNAMPVLLARTPGAPPETRYIDFVYHRIPGGVASATGIICHGTVVTDHVLSREATVRLLAESEQARTDAEVARAEAQIANSAKVDFLRKMSHELRTPLNAIAGYAALIEMGIHGPVTPAQLADLERIRLSQQHLLGLINGVLSFAKLESGSMEFIVETLLLDREIEAAVEIVTPQVRAARIEILRQPVPRDLKVFADADRLRQILINLLSNAIKFSRAGSRVRIGVEAYQTDVVISVSDDGVGIEPTNRNRIFDPFYQVRSDSSRTQEGTGLGLSISRELARGMGGELTVESTPGVGSTFSLRLPAGG